MTDDAPATPPPGTSAPGAADPDPTLGSPAPVATAEATGTPGATGATRTATRRRKGVRTAVEWVVLVAAAIAIALLVKAFLFQAFFIPSASMVPTLQVGDRVLVNKLSYKLHDVNRGDIVVFSAAPNQQWHKAGIDDLVKRVIALPGETVTQCEPGRICVDDRLLEEGYLPEGTTTDMNATPPGCAAGSPDDGCTVPAGHVFVMGDNRGQSADSRMHGPVKESSIVGRVFVRIWPVNRIGFM